MSYRYLAGVGKRGLLFSTLTLAARRIARHLIPGAQGIGKTSCVSHPTGDVLTLETASTLTRYVVESAEIVHESRVDVLERTGRAELTLITCFPFDAVVPGGPLRFVVHAAAGHSESAEVTGALPPRGSRTISRIAPSWALVLRSWNRSRGKSCLAQIIGTQIPIGTPRTNNKR